MHFNFQISCLGDKQFENPQTANLNKILKDCLLLKKCITDLNKPTTDDTDGQVDVQPDKKKTFVCTTMYIIKNMCKFYTYFTSYLSVINTLPSPILLQLLLPLLSSISVLVILCPLPVLHMDVIETTWLMA